MDNSSNSANSDVRISLRPVVLPDDEEFLTELYFSTREDLTALPLDAGQKNTILRIQYAAQKQQYERMFPNAAHDIILFDEQPVGRVLVTRELEESLCIDISIRPESRNLGIGAVVLRNLIDEAAQTGRVFSLHVLKMNHAAVRLYQRLGLVVTEENGTHYKMARRPLGTEPRE